jgi:type VI secretion system protein ImpB
MSDSTQHKLSRVRPPRVQITYDVETGGAIEKKELPFVVGVLSDLAGKPAEALPPLKNRKFVSIDRDNFNDVLESTAPRLAFQVQNRLTDEDSKINVELNFSTLDDFNPENIVRQVEPLRKLIEARERLSDLLAKLDGNDRLEQLLKEVVENSDQLKEIQDATAAPADN